MKQIPQDEGWTLILTQFAPMLVPGNVFNECKDDGVRPFVVFSSFPFGKGKFL